MARWRILAVDDDPDVLELIEMTLQSSYDVVTVETGQSIVEVVDAFEPDLIILDIMMPKVTGYHILETLKERKETSKIPIVFLSAKDTIRDQKYGYKLGATTYLTKPFQPERLLRNIDNIFQHTPPDRHAKRWTVTEAKERIRAIHQYGKVPEPKREPAQPIITNRTVHHREAEIPEDKIWRG